MTTLGKDDAARTVVGVFVDRDDARNAARELHDAGYKQTWIGTTRPHGPKDDSKGVEPGTLTGEVDGTDIVGGGGNVLEKIGRFFAGEGYTLNQALRDHGVAATDAAQLEESIAPGSSVLTVTLGDDDVSAGADDPATVIARCSGRLLTPESGLAADHENLERAERQQRDVAARRAGEIPTIHEDVFTERGPVRR